MKNSGERRGLITQASVQVLLPEAVCCCSRTCICRFEKKLTTTLRKCTSVIA